MSNSIVFQNNAEQLKTSIYGFNSTSGTYKPLTVNDAGELLVKTGTSVLEIGTINKIDVLGTVNYVGLLGTVNKVDVLGTVDYVGLLGTVNKVDVLGTVDYVSLLGTVNKVDVLGTVDYVGLLGTVNKVDVLGTVDYVGLLGTVNKVDVLGTVDYVGLLGTVNKVDVLGTVDYVGLLGTVNKVSLLGTLSNIVGTVKVNLVDRTFTTITQTITVASATTTYSDLINISKYQDTSWYFLNSSSTNRRAVTVQLAVTPSTAIGTYPRTLIIESATVNESPKVITNDYYLEYIAAQIRNTSSYQQNIVAVFNGRY